MALKAVLLLLSFVIYTLMFNWKLSLVVLAIIFTHEFGHLFAMNYTGMKNKGIFFIPGVGGAAVPIVAYRSYIQYIFVSIAGPLAGILSASIALLIAVLSANQAWAFIALLFAGFNLLNLLPATPFDGGHILKSFLFSLPKKIAIPLLILINVVVVGLSSTFIGIGWALLIYGFGLFQLVVEIFYAIKRDDLNYPWYKIPETLQRKPRSLSKKEALLGFVITIGTVIAGIVVFQISHTLLNPAINNGGLLKLIK